MNELNQSGSTVDKDDKGIMDDGRLHDHAIFMQCSCDSIAQVSAWWCQLSDDFPSSTFFSCR